MPDTLSNIGTTFSVSATLPATNDVAGYGALTFSGVTGVGSLGSIGPSYEVVNFTDLADGVVQKAHGSLNYGDPELQYRAVNGDTGQGILLTALTNRTKIAVEVVRASGLIQYFQALVTSNPNTEASATTTDNRTCNIAITSAIIEDATGV